ncbi:MAG: hypothetical protein EHM24_32900 [Acidobacteria bacterium]|nr:MAG: hypothetical protein EHM24_32900 [Acidobacteriota bacterium]
MKTSLMAVAVMLTVASGCSRTTSPAAPSGTGVVATVVEASGRAIGLSGYVRGLDARARAFTLVLVSSTAATVKRGDTATVKADDTTEVWVKGQQVRFSALQNGVLVGVRGTDQGTHVLARTISSR